MSFYKNEDIAVLKATASGSNIYFKWTWINSTVSEYVKNTLVFYLQEGDSKVNVLKLCGRNNKTECIIENVLLDSNYNICVKAFMKAQWAGVRESTICTRVTNKNWEMSAFIGSTVGALLALILIIILVLITKRVKKRQKFIKETMNPIPQRQRYDSAFESQFDSVAIREDTSFYDDLVNSEVSYFESSYKISPENSLSSAIMPSSVVICENSCIKGNKKRASLIEEESIGSQTCDGWMYTITSKNNEHTYQLGKESRKYESSSSCILLENKSHIIETCIDESDISDIPGISTFNQEDQSRNIGFNQSAQNDNVM